MQDDRVLAFRCEYSIGDEVIIDANPAQLATITGFIIGGTGEHPFITHALCAFVHDGANRTLHIEMYRLRLIK